MGGDLLVSGVVQATPDKLRSSYSVHEQVAKRIANVCIRPARIKQVAKLGPVSRAAGMDCECPLMACQEYDTRKEKK